MYHGTKYFNTMLICLLAADMNLDQSSKFKVVRAAGLCVGAAARVLGQSLLRVCAKTAAEGMR